MYDSAHQVARRCCRKVSGEVVERAMYEVWSLSWTFRHHELLFALFFVSTPSFAVRLAVDEARQDKPGQSAVFFSSVFVRTVKCRVHVCN